MVYVLAFSDRWWKKLPPAYQKIMEDSAVEMGIFQHNYLDYANTRGPQMAAKLGYQVHCVTDKEPWVKAMSNIWTDWAGKVPDGQALIDAVRAVK